MTVIPSIMTSYRPPTIVHGRVLGLEILVTYCHQNKKITAGLILITFQMWNRFRIGYNLLASVFMDFFFDLVFLFSSLCQNVLIITVLNASVSSTRIIFCKQFTKHLFQRMRYVRRQLFERIPTKLNKSVRNPYIFQDHFFYIADVVKVLRWLRSST